MTLLAMGELHESSPAVMNQNYMKPDNTRNGSQRGNFLRQKLFNFLRGSGPSANEAHGGAL